MNPKPLIATPALAAALAVPAIAADAPSGAAHMVCGPDDTRILEPAAVSRQPRRRFA